VDRLRIDTNGFTLVEALISLVISGLIGAALVALLVGQSRFYDRTDDQRNAEQIAQATFDLFSAEVRMAGGDDLLLAGTDTLSLRFDLLQAVVCDSTGADAAALYVFDRTTNAGLTGSFVGVAVSGPYDEPFEYADGWNPTPIATGGGPKSTCTAAGAPTSGSASDYLELSGWAANFAGGVPERGSFLRAYGSVTYRLAPSTFFAPSWSLWRGSQELVGPFEVGGAFGYVLDDGSETASVAAVDFDRVVAVRLTATAVGEGSNPYGVRRSVDFEVPFRN
jgi:type II secretory pathway pseudopilin PulG